MKKDHKKISQPKNDSEDIKEEIVEKPETEIQALTKLAEKNLDGWKRSQAEFENYRKRQGESQKELIKYATQNVILQLIPVLDNFHMSTEHIPEDQKDNGWVTGIMYIQKQLGQVLADNGVEEISVKIGDTFDPVMHEAIEDKECCGKDCDCKTEKKFKNKIKQILTKGYKLGEKVIRPVRVIVE